MVGTYPNHASHGNEGKSLASWLSHCCRIWWHQSPFSSNPTNDPRCCLEVTEESHGSLAYMHLDTSPGCSKVTSRDPDCHLLRRGHCSILLIFKKGFPPLYGSIYYWTERYAELHYYVHQLCVDRWASIIPCLNDEVSVDKEDFQDTSCPQPTLMYSRVLDTA